MQLALWAALPGLPAGSRRAGPLALIGVALVIVHEERMLEETFGEEYRAYRARVSRWI